MAAGRGFTKDGLALRIKSFRSFLRDNGIDSKVPFNLPHRVAAARAGKRAARGAYVATKIAFVCSIAIGIQRGLAI